MTAGRATLLDSSLCSERQRLADAWCEGVWLGDEGWIPAFAGMTGGGRGSWMTGGGGLAVVLRHVVYSLEAGGSQLMPLWVR